MLAEAWTSTDQVLLELIQSGQLGRFSALDPTDGGDTGRQILSGEWHRRDDQGYTRISAYAQRYRLQLFSNFTFFELRPSTGDQFEQEEHRDFFGAQIVQGWNHGLAGLDSISEAGLRVRHEDIRASLADTESRVPFRTVSDDRVGETETGLYLQNTTRWTQWLQTLAGVREQFISMKMDALATRRHRNHLPAAGSVALNRGAWPIHARRCRSGVASQRCSRRPNVSRGSFFWSQTQKPCQPGADVGDSWWCRIASITTAAEWTRDNQTEMNTCHGRAYVSRRSRRGVMMWPGTVSLYVCAYVRLWTNLRCYACFLGVFRRLCLLQVLDFAGRIG